MKVYIIENDGYRLLGTADVADDVASLEIPLFGRESFIVETYMVGVITHLNGEKAPAVERAVILAEGQLPELLPKWRPLSS
ncbi:hypothetical protein [Pseudoroseomonas cervicalis]|uniref:hypothetical protein n=1 Tax=Teichococcus cervicalis TaxID=204525 RepID=UPI0022F16E05|nr:hypothetical protein [Pseudoroseomonas cervicalis]WBV42544.1 hypothetical protein PFY06_15065 [Pseudoroseomonas cervicalis]